MKALEIKNLTINHRNQVLVQNIGFSIEQGQWFSLVGESGSGKTITALTVGRILPENLTIVSGGILLDGVDVSVYRSAELRKIRGQKVAYVFQDYQGAFTHFIRIGKQMDEMMRYHLPLPPKERKERIVDALDKVGLNGAKHYACYPFELSGGQLQRAAIAQATILNPSLIICDEPTTALDAISQKRVLDLIERIKNESGCAILFITHNLRCVQQYSDQVAVMRKGVLVETGEKNAIFSAPKHDYTRNLFASVPPLRNPPRRLELLQCSDDFHTCEKTNTEEGD